MSFLPDIVDGELVPEERPALFTPRERVRRPNFEADGFTRDKVVRRDAPKMSDIHECEPNIYEHCIYCNRKMRVL